MHKAMLFARLTKVDEAQRLVYGLATAEVKDKVGEKLDYATSKPLFEAWSGEMSKATDGINLGNVREMHGKSAAGHLTAIDYHDDSKSISVCAKVIDDQAWQKVMSRTYTGFSIGGAYAKTWDDPDEPGVRKYTARPSEISLVDNPCLAPATFTMVKADGSSAEVAPVLWEPSNDEIAAEATKIMKLEKGTDLAGYMDKARTTLMETRGGFAKGDVTSEDANEDLEDIEGDESLHDVADAEGDDVVDFSDAPGSPEGNAGGSSSKRKVTRKAWIGDLLKNYGKDASDEIVEKIDTALALVKTPRGVRKAIQAQLDKGAGHEPGDMAAYDAEEAAAVDAPPAKKQTGPAQGTVTGDDPAAKAAGAQPETPAAPDWGIDQTWTVRADGKGFAKKADAVAHANALKAVAESDTPISKALREALEKAKKGGDKPKPYGDVEYADPDDGKYPIDTPAHIRAAWSYVNMPKNASVLGDKADKVKAKIVAAWKDKIDASGPPSAEKMAAFDNAGAPALLKALITRRRELAKDFYTVENAADALCDLASLLQCVCWEETWEKDSTSKLPQMAMDAFAAARTLIVEMISEESAELLSAIQSVEGHDALAFLEPGLEMAAKCEELAKADTALLEKVGARNSAKDKQRIQAVHDHSTELGAKCDKDNVDDGGEVGGMADKVTPATLQKALADQAEKLNGEATAAIGELGKLVETLRGEIDVLKAQPTDMPTPNFRLVEKGDENGPSGGSHGGLPVMEPAQMVKALIDSIGLEQLQKLAFQGSFSQPKSLVDTVPPR